MHKVSTLTIGKLAKQAGVGIETVRYYQSRGLIPVPPETGSYRQYPASLVARIQFIKRAQELGFSLDEIGELLQLDQHTDRKT
ncbi:MAG TPA: MerR family transcriptional regulator, partial [Pseudomonadales bacterium]|nr:MerR family transcriptional regulator [Pseudomonadales bacterium]